MTKVDAHHHLWRVARGDYGWLPSHPEIHRDFLPADFLPLIKSADVERTVLVQAAPTLAETEFLLETARGTHFVAGVVGWIDFEAPRAAETIAHLSADPLLVGLRPMIHDLPDDEWLLSPAVSPAFDALISSRLRFDALVKPRHLKCLLRFLENRSDLTVVIDHGAKPDIAARGFEPWSDDMRRLAKETRAFCKISGLATEAGKGWRPEDLKPYVDVLLESFGPSRLMWGSDWPVVNEAGGFARWHDAAQWLTRELTVREREAVFGDTAVAFYGLGS